MSLTRTSPYNSAKGGVPGKGIGGYLVPAPGDDAHQFIAPKDTDIRGPCPGLNAAANRMLPFLRPSHAWMDPLTSLRWLHRERWNFQLHRACGRCTKCLQRGL
jgi:hypothetical protein